METAPIAHVKRSGKFSFTISYPISLEGRKVDEHKEYRTASGKFTDKDYEKFKQDNPTAPLTHLLVTE